MEGKRSRWGGWPSKPERAVSRLLVGSTPTLFRHILVEFSPCFWQLPRGRPEVWLDDGVRFMCAVFVGNNLLRFEWLVDL